MMIDKRVKDEKGYTKPERRIDSVGKEERRE